MLTSLRSRLAAFSPLVQFARYFLAFTLLALSGGVAEGATYFVSLNGSDSNPGTITQPWRTVAKSMHSMAAGDTAFVRSGTYVETGITSNSGVPGQPIVLAAFPGERPIIDGSLTTNVGRRPVFDLQGVHDIVLDGLAVRRGCRANIYLAYDFPVSNITISNCDLSDFVYDDNSAAVYVNTSGAENILIQNNRIHGVQLMPSGNNNAAGIILFHAGTVTIRNNEIYRTNNAVYYKHSTDDRKITLIENNLIYDQRAGTNSGRGLKISRSDCIISNNIIHSCDIGIELFEESSSCSNLATSRNRVLHNTVVDTHWGILLNRSSSCLGAFQTQVRDNLVFGFSDQGNRGLSVWPYQTGGDGSQTTEEYNLIFASAFPQPIRALGSYYTVLSPPSSFVGKTSTSVGLAPVFVDYLGRNFALRPNSPGWQAASDGSDMGAKVTTVGTGTVVPTDTIPPSATTDLRTK